MHKVGRITDHTSIDSYPPLSAWIIILFVQTTAREELDQEFIHFNLKSLLLRAVKMSIYRYDDFFGKGVDLYDVFEKGVDSIKFQLEL